MSEINPIHRHDANMELRNAIDGLIRTINSKTKTILRMQAQMDFLFQCIDSFCELTEAGRFDEMEAIVSRYKRLTAADTASKVH